MILPDDEPLDFDFDELELDENEEGQEAETEEAGHAEDGQAADSSDEDGQGRQVSRGERRIQSLANKARETERRAVEAETRERLLQQQLEAMRQQPAPQPQYDPRAEQEYLAALDPVERITYQFNRQLAQVQQQQTQQQGMMLDMVDRTMYQTKAATNPVYKKFEFEVEKMRTAEASRGRHFNREDILAFIVGQKMLQNKKSDKPKPKVTKKATQTTRPGNASTDVSSGRGRDSERNARAKRVSTYTF